MGRGISFENSNCEVQNGGYGGYDESTKINNLPNTEEIVKGSGNADTKPITITYNPTSTSSNYSGPGFTILQKLTEDLTGEKYEAWMKKMC